jgi:hypothetical protein
MMAHPARELTAVARIRITDARGNCAAAERTKRLTVDPPESVHTRFKSICAAKQRNMVEIIREKIERYLREEAA